MSLIIDGAVETLLWQQCLDLECFNARLFEGRDVLESAASVKLVRKQVRSLCLSPVADFSEIGYCSRDCWKLSPVIGRLLVSCVHFHWLF